MELIIDIFPVCVISLDHKEMMATKMIKYVFDIQSIRIRPI